MGNLSTNIESYTGQTNDETTLRLLFSLSLFSALILQNTGFPQSWSYVTVALVYATGCGLFLLRGDFVLKLASWPFVCLLLFSIVICINTLIYPSAFNFLRFVSFATITLLNFYIVPNVLELDELFSTLSTMGALIVVIGLLPLIGFPTQIGFIDITLWRYFSALDIPVITSVFTNPNQLGFFTLVGSLSALRQHQFSGSTVTRVLLWINALGLVLSHYRTGWVAFLIAVGTWYVYALWGRKGIIISTVGGIFAIIIGLAMLFAVIPGPQAIAEMSLNGRRELWLSSVDVTRDHSVVGAGLLGTAERVGNPHNTYLRIFASFGIVGGLLYSALVVGVTIKSVRQVVTLNQLVLGMILVAFLVVQIFNQLSFIGTSMRSSIIAMMMGYCIIQFR